MMKHLLKSVLLLCALIAGSGSVWAEEVTISVGSSSLTWTADGNDYTATSGDFNLKYEKGTYTNAISGGIQSAELRLYSGTNFVISSINTITKIVYTVADGSGKNYSVSALSTADENLVDGTWTGSATSVSASLSAQNRIKSVTITYIASAKTDPTISFNDGSVRVGKTLDLSTLFSSNSDGEITYSITAGGSYATIDGNIMTGVAEGDVTVKAEQAADGAYNAGEATATITIEEALTLSSIAVTTAPTTTTYTEDETFDATGMVVTATYSDSSTDDVTAFCTWSPSGALKPSDTEITISYTENGVEKTTTQTITVTPYVQPTSVTIQMTNSLFGEEVHTSGKSTSEMTFVGTQDRVTVTYYVPDDSYYYFNTSNVRPYNTCTLTYGAPTGYAISRIVFTSDGNNWNDATPSVGAMTESKQWDGLASSVTFSWETTGTRIKTVVITLAKVENIVISSATWATFSSTNEVEIPAGVTAYYAQKKDASTVTLKEIEGGYIPANTGVVVSGAANTYTANVTTTGALAETNLLKPWTTAGTPTDGTYYTLAVDGGKPVFKKSNGGVLAAGKAYLVMPDGARELTVDFGGETTGVNEELRMKNEESSAAPVYNLNGQRVAQPTRGLYIVNGKKVVVK